MKVREYRPAGGHTPARRASPLAGREAERAAGLAGAARGGGRFWKVLGVYKRRRGERRAVSLSSSRSAAFVCPCARVPARPRTQVTGPACRLGRVVARGGQARLGWAGGHPREAPPPGVGRGWRWGPFSGCGAGFGFVPIDAARRRLCRALLSRTGRRAVFPFLLILFS